MESLSRALVADAGEVDPAFAFELRGMEKLLREVILVGVEFAEDSTALASAIETLEFPLAKTVLQTLIASFTSVAAIRLVSQISPALEAW